MQQLAQRVAIAWRTDETESARRISIRAEPSGAGFIARIEYLDESSHRVMRSVNAPSCDQAIAGIALVAAITLEVQSDAPANAGTGDQRPPAERLTGAEATAGPQTRNTASATAAQGATNSTPQRVAPRADSTAQELLASRDVRSVPSSAVRLTQQELGVLAGAGFGVGPGVALGAGASWGIGKRPFPTFRAVATWYEYQQASSASKGFKSQFRVIAFTPQLCSGRRLFGLPALIGALCMGIELGQYRVNGIAEVGAKYRGQTNHLFWASAEFSIPLRIASGRLFVELQPLVRFPLLSGTFNLTNGESGALESRVYRIPRIALGLNLVTGLSF